jgi:hypothetical protein
MLPIRDERREPVKENQKTLRITFSHLTPEDNFEDLLDEFTGESKWEIYLILRNRVPAECF